jgi:hypothetical protein
MTDRRLMAESEIVAAGARAAKAITLTDAQCDTLAALTSPAYGAPDHDRREELATAAA